MSTKFVVTDTFDLSFRPGLLVTGRIDGDAVGTGTTLQTEAGDPVQVLGVEFLSEGNKRDGTVTLMVDRANAASIQTGVVLSAG